MGQSLYMMSVVGVFIGCLCSVANWGVFLGVQAEAVGGA